MSCGQARFRLGPYDVKKPGRGDGLRFMETRLRKIGQFDVVLYLGVLYHTENPLKSLRKVAQLTREVAIIETEAVVIVGHDARPLCEHFPPKTKLMDDPTNFWVPNTAAVIGQCETTRLKKGRSIDDCTDSAKRKTSAISLSSSRLCDLMEDSQIRHLPLCICWFT